MAKHKQTIEDIKNAQIRVDNMIAQYKHLLPAGTLEDINKVMVASSGYCEMLEILDGHG